MSSPELDHAIAIVGMACRFPDASTPDQFWSNLLAGRESVRLPDEATLRAAGVDDASLRDPAYVRACVPLEDHDTFDAAFFGLSPRDARVMDPQHRKFLECAWNALEDGGHTPASVGGNIGVYAGSGMHWYLLRNVLRDRRLVDDLGEFLVRHTGNDKDFLATRASWQMDLRGPSLNIQTACSTSLVAVHLACQSLLHGECDMALAGGSSIEVPHGVGYLYRPEEIRSLDGHCRPMDADASGTVFGSGCGVVVLRRLADALADGDRVVAVIRGTAINNDGAGKAGFLAPSVDGQAQCIAEAIAVAGIDAGTLGYVEAHGTGTKIGDPIEIAALTQAFGATPRRQYCVLGSVKSNFGHLDTAAGVAGLIKVALALRHRRLPPTLHFRHANPEIDFAASPFVVEAAARDWPALGAPLRAGISSLGVGGTNAHIVLEEAPRVVGTAAGPVTRPFTLCLSAKSAPALAEMAQRLSAFLAEGPHAAWADVAWTLRKGRVAFEHRLSVNAGDPAQAIESLARATPRRAALSPPRIVFLFPGQGTQYPGMARALRAQDSIFRDELEACFAILAALGRGDVAQAIEADGRDDAAVAALENTRVAQPALFCIEYALARCLLRRGLQPDALVGHSLGEYVAACLCGVFSLDSALRLVCARGELVAALPGGAMLAVALGEEALRPYLAPRLALAAVNAEQSCVCSGSADAIAELARRLHAEGIAARALRTSHAFHSPMLDPILRDFADAVRAARPAAASGFRIASTRSGSWLDPAAAAAVDYWVRQLREPVAFAAALRCALEPGDAVLVEVGPGTTLGRFATLARAESRVVYTLPGARESVEGAAWFEAVPGRLWEHGVDVDWSAWGEPTTGQRVALPTYPFQRQRHWIDPSPVDRAAPAIEAAARRPLASWCSTTDWRNTPARPQLAAADTAAVLLLAGQHELADSLRAKLRASSVCVHSMRRADARRHPDDRDMLDPAIDADWSRFEAALAGVRQVVYLWPLDAVAAGDDAGGAALALTFDHLLRLAQALIRARGEGDPLELVVVTRGAQVLPGSLAANPLQALVGGVVRTLPAECPAIRTSWIDLAPDAAPNPVHELTLLARELRSESAAVPSTLLAMRGRLRLEPVATPWPLAQAGVAGFRRGGTYLITGALGGIGLALAGYLARHHAPRLLLVSRTRIPQRESWDEVLRATTVGDPVRRAILALRQLEARGATVVPLSVDVADGAALHAGLVALGIERLDGIVHAAGVLDDAPILRKSLEAAHRVLRPKVLGALALQRLLPMRPAFIAYCSSTSASAGVAGQVDYAAANAYLDALAMASDAGCGETRHVALAWSAWRDVGMAAALAAQAGLAPGVPEDVDPVDLPVLRWRRETAAGWEYGCIAAADSIWYLDQHRLRSGAAVMPGTGYLDLMLSALHDALGGFAPVRVLDLYFPAPLLLHDRQRRRLRLVLRRSGDARYQATIGSIGAASDDVLDHASATLEVLAPDAMPPSDPLPDADSVALVQEPYRHPLLEFGPAWDCLRELRFAADRAELQLVLEVPELLLDHPLHPAMLDMAVGAAQRELAGTTLPVERLLPYRYGEIRVLAPLRSTLRSRVRGIAKDEALWLDADIEADDGTVLLRVRDLVLRVAPAPSARSTRIPSAALERRGRAPATIDDAISIAEAMEVFERVLSCPGPAHLSVSPIDAGVAVAAALPEPSAGETPAPAGAAERPSLRVAFLAPASELERQLAKAWESILEMRGIGVNDDFFELGGHSLLLTRLIARLRRDPGVEIPLEQAFEGATIAQWARLAQSSPAAIAPAVRRVDRERYRIASTGPSA